MENRSSKVHNSKMFDWNDLKYFLAVARSGSTLAAAKMLGTSQSTVHRRLLELEKRIGCTLIKRDPRGYRLTELGNAMLIHAEHVEAAVVSFERNLAASNQNLTGSVRVTCPEAFGYRLMSSTLIDRFKTRYPALRVELVMSDEVLDLAKGEADIAVRRAPSTDRGLVGRKIADFPWAIYASRTYVARYGHIERFEDINGHCIVEFDGPMRNHPSARWLKSTAPNAQVVARSNSLSSVLLAVKSGVGLAPLPVIVGESETGLTRILATIPGLIDTFYLLMHKDMKQTPRVRAFFDFFIAELKSIRPILTR